MELRAVFLDVGQTLIHEKPSRFAIYAATARAHGCAIEDERMRDLMHEAHGALPRVLDGAFRYSDPWFRTYIARIFGERLGLAPRAVDEVTEELFERFEDPATFALFPGVDALLDTLRTRGLVAGVISNWSARLPRVLEGLGLLERFDFVLCSALECMEKPEPAIFEAALARAGVAPGEALHAGDHARKDVEAARRVGLAAVRIDHGKGGSGEDEHVLGSLPELRSYILERLA
jgi:putative hydrolase of the HAD superfamily